MTRRRSLTRVLKYLLPYGLGALLLLALQRTGLRESINLLLYDLITDIRPASNDPSKPITLIGISEQDVGRLGWPIDDALLCRAIDRLEAGGVAAIGLDLYRDRGLVPNRPACGSGRHNGAPIWSRSSMWPRPSDRFQALQSNGRPSTIWCWIPIPWSAGTWCMWEARIPPL